MEISQHYSPYAKKTLIVITNNETARLIVAEDRTIEEVDLVKVLHKEPDGRVSGTPNDGPAPTDEMRTNDRAKLYKELNTKLMQSKDADRIILCAPEALKNEIVAALHTDIQASIKEVVPKNLASLPLDAIMRILEEGRSL